MEIQQANGEETRLSPRQLELLRGGLQRRYDGNITRFAEEARVDRSYLSEILNGHAAPGNKVAHRLATALQLPLGVFTPGVDVDLLLRAGGARFVSDRAVNLPPRGRGAAQDGRTQGNLDEYPYVAAPLDEKKRLERYEVDGDCQRGVIDPGDHIIVDVGGWPSAGDIVLVELLEHGDLLVKRWFKEGGQYRLESETQEPILVDAEKCHIRGVVLERIQRIERRAG